MANNRKKGKETAIIGDMDPKEKRKMKKLIKELGELRGRHTELVSVYVPAGYNLTDIIGQLKDEQGTAANIKSKATRKNVMSALEKIIQHLRVFKATPPKGVVVFAGNVSENEGKDDIKLWSFEPPEPMRTKIYWCDQTFVLDPLEEMVREREVYALIILDARDANIGLLVGKTIKPLKHMDSTVPSKTVKGGMSQHRYDRLREDAIHDFLTKVGVTANELLMKEELQLKGMIIGGPGPVKERFAKGKYLNYDVITVDRKKGRSQSGKLVKLREILEDREFERRYPHTVGFYKESSGEKAEFKPEYLEIRRINNVEEFWLFLNALDI